MNPVSFSDFLIDDDWQEAHERLAELEEKLPAAVNEHSGNGERDEMDLLGDHEENLAERLHSPDKTPTTCRNCSYEDPIATITKPRRFPLGFQPPLALKSECHSAMDSMGCLPPNVMGFWREDSPLLLCLVTKSLDQRFVP